MNACQRGESPSCALQSVPGRCPVGEICKGRGGQFIRGVCRGVSAHLASSLHPIHSSSKFRPLPLSFLLSCVFPVRKSPKQPCHRQPAKSRSPEKSRRRQIAQPNKQGTAETRRKRRRRGQHLARPLASPVPQAGSFLSPCAGVARSLSNKLTNNFNVAQAESKLNVAVRYVIEVRARVIDGV